MKIYQSLFIALVAFLIIGCGGAAQPAASPTDVLKTFIEASKKKDVEAIKKTLSKGSLDLAEEAAKKQNITVDELFKKDDTKMSEELPELRNEKIEGDTATVEVKDNVGGYDTLPFVRENGGWKLAFDKYQQAMIKKMTEQMKIPETNVSKPDGDNPPGANSNK